jgi:hypothetical protein
MKNLDPSKKANSTLTNGNSSSDDDDTLEEESDEETATAMITKMQTQKTPKKKSRGNTNEDFVLSKALITNFGFKVMNYFRIPPRSTFLLGSLDKEVPVVQRKPRQASKKEKPEDLEEVRTKIRELKTNSTDTETGSTIKEIERIYRVLEKKVGDNGKKK